MVKNPLAMRETWVRSLGREDPLEKGTVTHSNILAWRIPWTEELGGLQSRGLQRVRHNWSTFTHVHTPMKKFTVKSWLVKLQRLSRPTVCCLQAGDPGKPVVWFIWSRKTWEPKVPRAEGDWCPALSPRAGRARFFLCLLVLFQGAVLIRWCPITLGGQAALLSSLIQMLILSRNTLTDTPRAPCEPVKLVHKINHHNRCS